jgi:hypothetical protein
MVWYFGGYIVLIDFFFLNLGHTWILIIRSILMILNVFSTMSQKSHELFLVWTLHCMLVDM